MDPCLTAANQSPVRDPGQQCPGTAGECIMSRPDPGSPFRLGQGRERHSSMPCAGRNFRQAARERSLRDSSIESHFRLARGRAVIRFRSRHRRSLPLQSEKGYRPLDTPGGSSLVGMNRDRSTWVGPRSVSPRDRIRRATPHLPGPRNAVLLDTQHDREANNVAPGIVTSSSASENSRAGLGNGRRDSGSLSIFGSRRQPCGIPGLCLRGKQ